MNQLISIPYKFIPKFTTVKYFNPYYVKITYCKREKNSERVIVKSAPRRRTEEWK
jgi:hypothetical protein